MQARKRNRGDGTPGDGRLEVYEEQDEIRRRRELPVTRWLGWQGWGPRPLEPVCCAAKDG